MLAHNKDSMRCGVLGSRVIGNHSYYFVIILDIDSPHTGSGPSQCPCVILVEAAATSATSGKQDLALSVSHHGIKQLVPVTHGYGNHTICTRS